MKVSELDLEPVIVADPGESMADAADRMRFYEIGSLVVIEDGGLVGIVTERDMVRAAAERVDLRRVPVRRYVTSAPATITPQTEVEGAAQLMLVLGVRHLPVVEGSKPVGMVSIRDMLAAEITIHAPQPVG